MLCSITPQTSWKQKEVSIMSNTVVLSNQHVRLTYFIMSLQYMSAIFYHNEEQKRLAEETMKAEQEKFCRPVRTSILPCKAFYEAEE